MKKEIKKLVASQKGSLTLGPTLVLYRYTRDALGYQCDRLELLVLGLVYNYPDENYTITARDPEGIVEQVADAVADFCRTAGNQIAKEIRNGYLR